MGFLTELFGGSDNTLVTVILSLAVVLVLIVLGVWVLKLIFQATGNVTRGRNKRLAVVDSMALDPKRQLVLLRRDNVEHLVILGGNTDLVVERDIAASSRAEASRPSQTTRSGTQSPRPANEPVARQSAQRPRAQRHPGLIQPTSRHEPDINPQPLSDEQRFNEANKADSAKSDISGGSEGAPPAVELETDLDSGGEYQRRIGKKKKRG